MARADAFVTPDQLQARLQDPRLRIVDASWYLPQENRDPKQEFEVAHIPGAKFLSIDAISDPDSDLPHMLPSPATFAAAVSAIGIGVGDPVVVYDSAGLFSAPRLWWTFRVFGQDDVRILDGGWPRWQAEGRPVESGPAAPSTPAHPFTAHYRAELVRDMAWMRQTDSQIVDARGRGRFEGTAPEPRPGLRSGHIPGSINLPYTELVANGALKDDAELRAAFAGVGVDLGRPVDATCGSGMTACIVALAAFVLGVPSVAVYDGSWSEFGRLGSADEFAG